MITCLQKCFYPVIIFAVVLPLSQEQLPHNYQVLSSLNLICLIEFHSNLVTHKILKFKNNTHGHMNMATTFLTLVNVTLYAF